MIYAIGDIHGQLDLIKRVHARVADDIAKYAVSGAKILHIGDLVDRGPDSAGVVQYLLDLHRNAPDMITLKGNHDRMFVTFVQNGGAQDPRLRRDLDWLHERLGGRDTLASYGASAADLSEPASALEAALDKVPPEHLAFLDALPDHYEGPHHFFAHAGIRPGVPFAAQTEDDLVWIRQEFLEDTRSHPKPVVHGHTPVKTVEHHGNRIAIDTGAAYGGPLSVVALGEEGAFELGPKGRIELRPMG